MDAGTDPYLCRSRIQAFFIDQAQERMARDLLHRTGPAGMDGRDDPAAGIVQQQWHAIRGEYADEHLPFSGIQRVAWDRVLR